MLFKTSLVIDLVMKASRRHFLKSSLPASIAFSSLGLGNVAHAIEPIKRAGASRFLLSLAAYSFRTFFSSKDPAKQLDLFKFIDYCADHDCDGAELTAYYFPKDLTDDYLIKLRRHAFLRGIAISGSAVGNNFALPNGEKRDEQIRYVKTWVDHAAVLGAPHIRVFAGAAQGISDGEARKMCVSAMEECCDYAGKKGIFLGLENHGGIVAEADGLLEIIKAIKSPWLGINLDTGNFHTEDPYADLAKIAPYAVNVQVKAVIHPRDKEAAPVDMPRLFKILREANYQGYVALEYEAKDPYEAIPGLLKELKKFTV
ncbi:MAG: sugar phosphate isomerase/epimerase family protein [Limisphaerales bacterium]